MAMELHDKRLIRWTLVITANVLSMNFPAVCSPFFLRSTEGAKIKLAVSV